MFTAFFYLCRERGLHVSLNEWLSLLEAMERGLHQSSLSGFYQLCRALLVKSEVDFDRFDQIFLEFFQDIPFKGELPDEFLDWLNHPAGDWGRSLEELKRGSFPGRSFEEILKLLEERIKEQKEEHNCGSYWVGARGRTPFGNSGWSPGGIRFEGQGRHRTAMSVASERRFRDFRKDQTLDTRQFQMAFRLLRQISAQSDSSEQELDVDGTIRDTCDKAGTLQIRYRKPRKNMIKVLLLMDSGGSMEPYSKLCAQLFQAAAKSNHFKELHTFYFHNCVYDELFKTPKLEWQSAVETEWVLKNFDSNYRVIIVGDAAMSLQELRAPQYNWGRGTTGPSGLEWLRQFQARFPYLIWMNPNAAPAHPGYWEQTHYQLAQIFRMYQLTADGLEQGMRKLMTR